MPLTTPPSPPVVLCQKLMHTLIGNNRALHPFKLLPVFSKEILVCCTDTLELDCICLFQGADCAYSQFPFGDITLVV